MDILSVKNLKGTTTIKDLDSATKDGKGDAVTSVLQSKELPAPAFFEALAGVSAVFMKSAMQKPTSNCIFVLANLKYDNKEPRSAECSCVVTERQPGGIGYNIYFDPIFSINLTSKATPDEKKFQDLIKEAKAFIKGERAEKKLL